MALWHQIRRSGIQRLILSPQNPNFLFSPTRSFAVPAHIKAMQQKKEESSGPRLNEAITAERLRLVTDEGHNIVSRCEALDRARKLNLDLVEVQRNPPVCRIMDFHKEKFIQETKEKERAKSKALRNGENKEVRFKGKTELKDIKIKAETVTRLMERGYRVKCTALPSGKQEKSEDLSAIIGEKEGSSAKRKGKEDFAAKKKEREDLSAKKKEKEDVSFKRKDKEDLRGLLTRLLALIEDVAVVESGPHVVEGKQAYIIVRHAKFTTKKSGKKAVKPLEALAKVGSLPNESKAVDNNQDEEWELEESETENEDVDINKTATYQKPSVSNPESKKVPSFVETNRYAKQSEPNRYPQQRERMPHQANRNESDARVQFDPRQRQVTNRNESDARVQIDPKQRQYNNNGNNERYNSPKPNASIDQIKPKAPIFGKLNDEKTGVPSVAKSGNPSSSTPSYDKFSASKTVPPESTVDQIKNSSAPKKSYGIFSK